MKVMKAYSKTKHGQQSTGEISRYLQSQPDGVIDGMNKNISNEQLVARIKAHDDEANNMLLLWRQTERLISKIANKYSCYAEFEDLKQEGYFGLCEAVEHFDIEKDVKFSTYAVKWIRQSIQRYIENNGRSVRIPVHALNQIWKYKRIVAEYWREYGTEPPDRYLVRMLGVSRKELEIIKENVPKATTTSLNTPIGSDDEEITLGDTIPSEYNMEDDCIRKIDHEAMSVELWQAVEELKPEQCEAIKKKYIDGMTFKEMAEGSGVTDKAMNVRVYSGLRTLRHGKHRESLREYYKEFFPTVPIEYKGVRSFQRDWTSTTEQTALYEMEQLERRHLRNIDAVGNRSIG